MEMEEEYIFYIYFNLRGQGFAGWITSFPALYFFKRSIKQEIKACAAIPKAIFRSIPFCKAIRKAKSVGIEKIMAFFPALIRSVLLSEFFEEFVCCSPHFL